jgi:hypothetical protein
MNFKIETGIIKVENQKIYCQYIVDDASGLRIQLIQPTDEMSPVYNAMKRGGGPNHLCFSVDCLDSFLSELKKDKFKIITPPFRGEGVNNRRAAFTYKKGIGLTEFVEKI